MSAKGSVPLPRRSAPLAFEVLGDEHLLMPAMGHLVEIIGLVSPDASASESPRLTVQQLKVVSPSCSQ
jgi:hypothetical protein